jgi:arylsulfatase A-like enzyme
MRRPSLDLAALGTLALASLAGLLPLACRRTRPAPPAPPIVRVDVTPNFGQVRKEDPEAEIAEWRRKKGVVLGDLRASHAVAPGAEILLPLPAGGTGKRTLATAFAARRRAGTERTGDASITVEVEQKGSWRSILEYQGPIAPLLEGWVESRAEIADAAALGPGARVRASVTNAPEPESIELLVEPVRALERRTDERWNVFVFSVDTLRADHLGCYGYARATSPHVDAIAKEGVLFEHVVAPAPWTLPSYGSFFTGCSPALHRAGVNTEKEERFGHDEDATKKELEALRSDLPTLAETLASAGYATAGFQANSFLRAKNGLARGFDRYVFYQYRSDFGAELAMRWIEDHRSRPWFCFLHVMDVHQPYSPPPPYDRKFSERSFEEVADYPPNIEALRAKEPDAATRKLLVDEYDGAIASVDDRIGQVLDKLRALGELDRTLVVIHSDHGEEFWEHGGYEHGHAEHEEILHVPLVLRMPGKLPKGARIAPRVRGIDVMPTVIALLGIRTPPGIEGKSLLPLVEGKSETPRECISEATLHGPREIKALTSGSERLSLAGTVPGVLYDLGADPGETKDLRAERTARAKEMEDRLLHRHEVLVEAAARGGKLQLSPEDIRLIEQLGYGGAAEQH